MQRASKIAERRIPLCELLSSESETNENLAAWGGGARRKLQLSVTKLSVTFKIAYPLYGHITYKVSMLYVIHIKLLWPPGGFVRKVSHF